MLREKGFTLVEAMIAIAVLGVLVALAAPSFVSTIETTKARKTSDTVLQMIHYAKSEALNKNKDVFLTVKNNAICLSWTTAHGCEIRSDPIQNGATVSINDTDTNQVIKFTPVHGIPDTTATIAITANSASKTITLNILGIATVS